MSSTENIIDVVQVDFNAFGRLWFVFRLGIVSLQQHHVDWELLSALSSALSFTEWALDSAALKEFVQALKT